MSATPRDQRRRREGGFALLVLMALAGVGSVGILLAAQALLPTIGGRGAEALSNLTAAHRGARLAFRRNGSFPADLDALATAAELDAQGRWRLDPQGAAADLDLAVVGVDLRLRTRGVDGQLGTADDQQESLSAETQMRIRQRPRLRLMRAALLRSSYRLGGAMTAVDEAAMRAAAKDYAQAKRAWLGSDAAGRVALTARMTAAAATISALAAAYGLAGMPASLTGAGGLMSQLGMSDSRAVDGAGAPLQVDPVLGVSARGSDGTGGTDDDM